MCGGVIAWLSLMAFAGGCPSRRDGRGMAGTVGDTGSRYASACVSSGSGVGAGNFSEKTGLIAVKWKSWRKFGIREKVWAAQEIGMGSYVRARHAWVCHACVMRAWVWVWVGACGCGCVWIVSVWRFENALKTNRKSSCKRRRKRVRWIQRKGEKGGFLGILGSKSGKVGRRHEKSRAPARVTRLGLGWVGLVSAGTACHPSRLDARVGELGAELLRCSSVCQLRKTRE